MRRAPRAEPETARQEARLEDRLEHDLRGSLHDPVADSGNRERPLFIRSRLRDKHPPGRQRPVPSLPHLHGQLTEQPGHPVLLSVRQADTVNASSAAVAAHILPRPVQHIPAVDLVEQRMEPSCRVGLGRPVKRMLQSADPVPTDSRQGGPSRNTGTHRSGPFNARVNEAAALPSPQVVLSCRSERYYGRLRLPPGRRPLPGSTPVIERRLPRLSAARSGRGGPLQFPPPPSERSAPSYAGESLAAAFQDLHRFHGLRREPPGSALSSVSNDAAGFASATDRSVAPP